MRQIGGGRCDTCGKLVNCFDIYVRICVNMCVYLCMCVCKCVYVCEYVWICVYICVTPPADSGEIREEG